MNCNIEEFFCLYLKHVDGKENNKVLLLIFMGMHCNAMLNHESSDVLT